MFQASQCQISNVSQASPGTDHSLSLAGKATSSVYSRYQDSSDTSCGPLLITGSLLTQVRVFRVAASRAARPLASVLSLDSAPAPFACRNVTPQSETVRTNLVSEVPVFSLCQYSIEIPIEIRRLRTDNLVDMVSAPLDFQHSVQFVLTSWIVRRLGNNIFTCFARFSGKCIDHTSSIDQIYNIGIANRRGRHQKYKFPRLIGCKMDRFLKTILSP